MNRWLEEKSARLSELCDRNEVRRLAVFGSALRDDFTPSESDVDLLVEFKPMPPAQYARNYFKLLAELEQLFGTAVDLVEAEPIENPYFLKELEATKVILYEAGPGR